MNNERICEHCGINQAIQPSKESGCNHVHYPEACEVCNAREELKRPYMTIKKTEYKSLKDEIKTLKEELQAKQNGEMK